VCNSQNLIVQDLGQARPRSRKCSDVSASSSPEAVSGGLQAGPSEMVEGGAALSPPLHSLPLVLAPLMMSCCLMMMMNGFYWENGNRDQNLVYEHACSDVLSMHGEVEEVWSGGSACWFDRSLVPGDVNPHGDGLGACEADG